MFLTTCMTGRIHMFSFAPSPPTFGPATPYGYSTSQSPPTFGFTNKIDGTTFQPTKDLYFCPMTTSHLFGTCHFTCRSSCLNCIIGCDVHVGRTGVLCKSKCTTGLHICDFGCDQQVR